MSNPVTQLLELLDEWDTGENVFSSRGLNSDDPLAGWRNIRKATDLLSRIEDFTDRIGTTDRYADTLATMWMRVILPRSDWLHVEAAALEPADLERFHMLEDLYSNLGGLATAITSAELETLRETLVELREQIGGLGQLPSEQRNYLLQLIANCLRLLDAEDPDLVAVRATSNELAGACLTAVPSLPEEDRKEFFNKLVKIAFTWFGNATSGAAGGIGAAAFMGLLGS